MDHFVAGRRLRKEKRKNATIPARLPPMFNEYQPQQLSEPHEHQGDENKESRHDRFDGSDESRYI